VLDEFTLGVEDLDAVIAGVGDPDMVVGVDRDALRAAELARFFTAAAPL
jgi:hypothetical protein